MTTTLPTTTMRAAVYRGEGRVMVESVPVPQIGPGELLVEVAVCGVCPTDVKKIHSNLLPPPRIYGHETAGVVAAKFTRNVRPTRKSASPRDLSRPAADTPTTCGSWIGLFVRAWCESPMV